MNQLPNALVLPRPQRVTHHDGTCRLTDLAEITFQSDDALLANAAQRIQRAALDGPGISWPVRTSTAANGIHLRVDASVADGRAQGSSLRITPKAITVTGRDAAGAFYGALTLVQLLRQTRDTLPAGEIIDWPDYPTRGVMLDVSRDKVPTMETLFALVERLAEWKINRFELYTEHTFAYREHPEVWAKASPMTHEEIRLLDAYCRARAVELVPNQNSFGHMHRWLKFPRYRPLAESPDGFDAPWGVRVDEPFTLAATVPGSLELMAGLYDELFPCFASRNVNIGCDETYDLGLGRSREACEQRGKGRVYLDFLLQLFELVRRRGRTPHFWGDIILKHPELIPELPRDVIALVWGYEADHPFMEQAEKFAATGLPFFVCPGTSSWNSLVGRTDKGFANLRNAAESGQRHGAVGFLNTDWGDNGHWQYLSTSDLPFAYGATVSWNAGSAGDETAFFQAADLHVFHDESGVARRIAWELGCMYQQLKLQNYNSTVLFHLLQNQDLSQMLPKLEADNLQGTIEAALALLPEVSKTRMTRPDAALVRDELTNGARIAAHACRRGLAAKSTGAGTPTAQPELAAEFRPILEEHKRLWLARNRIGGLSDSLFVLLQRLKEYESA